MDYFSKTVAKIYIGFQITKQINQILFLHYIKISLHLRDFFEDNKNNMIKYVQNKDLWGITP
jgi:hypothetical protein